jgi:hypothetical protein
LKPIQTSDTCIVEVDGAEAQAARIEAFDRILCNYYCTVSNECCPCGTASPRRTPFAIIEDQVRLEVAGAYFAMRLAQARSTEVAAKAAYAKATLALDRATASTLDMNNVIQEARNNRISRPSAQMSNL